MAEISKLSDQRYRRQRPMHEMLDHYNELINNPTLMFELGERATRAVVEETTTPGIAVNVRLREAHAIVNPISGLGV